jgi:hypothetical protein
MKAPKIPTDLGSLLKQAKFTTRARDFLNTVAGRNIEKVMSEQHQKVMNLPYVRQVAKQNPGNMSTFESYVTKSLQGKAKNIPSVADLPRETKGRLQLIDALLKGNQAVKAERARALRSRLGLSGAVIVPGAIGAGVTSKYGALIEQDSYAPSIGAGIAGSAPIIQGARSGALGRPEVGGRMIKNVEKLESMLKPGDILLTSKPGYGSHFKAPIAMMGGDPFGYHVETVLSTPKSGPRFIHSTPAAGGASVYSGGLIEGEDVIVKRLKDQSQVKEFLKNLKKYKGREDVLEKMLGEYARAGMYDTGAAIKGGAKSFIPEPLRRLFFKEKAPLPGATVCSSLPGMTCPVDLAPGVPKHEIMPHHLQRSAALETVGHYRAPRKLHQKIYEGLLRASPWVTRGALGLGLGYGAYRGLKALTD